MRRQAKYLVTALLAAVSLLALSAGGAQAVSSAEAIRQLNQQRIANGIPGVRSVGALARGCAKHNAYMALNGTLTHYEQHGKPGFTAAGNRAGRSSVLSYGSPPWSSPRRNPWETAPIHLAQLLAPSLAVSGYAEAQRYACAQTLALPRRPEPAANRVYTYPGPDAAIYPAETAAELPYTPGELIGVTGRTGPYLYVMVDGPDRIALYGDGGIESASLRDAGGNSVPVRFIDGTHPKLRGFIPPGGFVIPTSPLKPKTTYTASVTLSIGGEPLEHSWSFRTS